MLGKILISLTLLLAATSLAVGCGETTVKSEAEPSSESQGTPAAAPASSQDGSAGDESASDESARNARVGDTMTLHGFESDLAMKVTLLDFVANDQSYDHSEYAFEALIMALANHFGEIENGLMLAYLDATEYTDEQMELHETWLHGDEDDEETPALGGVGALA